MLKSGLQIVTILLYSGQKRICDRFLNLAMADLIDARDRPIQGCATSVVVSKGL